MHIARQVANGLIAIGCRVGVQVIGEEEVSVGAEEEYSDDGPDDDDATTRTQLLALERQPHGYQTLRRQQDERPRRHLQSQTHRE